MPIEFISPEIDPYIGAAIVIAILGVMVHFARHLKHKSGGTEKTTGGGRSSKPSKIKGLWNWLKGKGDNERGTNTNNSEDSELPPLTENTREDATAEQGEENAAEQLGQVAEATNEIVQDLGQLPDPSSVQETQGLSLLEQAESYFRTVFETLLKSKGHISHFVNATHNLGLDELREEQIFERELINIKKIEVLLQRENLALEKTIQRAWQYIKVDETEIARLESGISKLNPLKNRELEEKIYDRYSKISYSKKRMEFLWKRVQMNNQLLTHISDKKKVVEELIGGLFRLGKRLEKLKNSGEILENFEDNLNRASQHYFLMIRQAKGLVIARQTIDQSNLNRNVNSYIYKLLGYIKRMAEYFRRIDYELFSIINSMFKISKGFIIELELSKDVVKEFKRKFQLIQIEKKVFKEGGTESDEKNLIHRTEKIESSLINRAKSTSHKCKEKKEGLVENIKRLDKYLKKLDRDIENVKKWSKS